MLPRTLLAAALAVGFVANAQAQDWFVRFGPTVVDPKNDNGTLANGAFQTHIKDQTALGFTLGYHFTPNWALELLASTPFEHSVQLNGGTALDFKHLPPTLSLQYYFLPESKVNPFLGVGANYTLTFSEKERGPLVGTNTKVGDSFGIAAQAGLVFNIAEQWDIVADARWMNIDASVKVDGTKVGTTHVDPMIYGLHLGYRF
jgi:outer membrane protein